jgi:FkbM family methyltransferase
MTVVDIGASIGFFSFYASQKVGSTGKVIAFEPEPTSYRALVENIEANQATNVIPIQMGLWSECTCKDICPTPVLTGSSFMNCADGINVKLGRLDRILPKLGITHVDFVKIDAEGAAMHILEGSTEMLSSIENFAIAAYHTQENVRQIEKFLGEYGFRTRMLRRYGLYPFVYATRNPNINLQFVETWQILLVGSVGLLALYFILRKR